MKKGILWDCHMHSSFSADSDTPMENMVLKALSLGLKGVTFTEHLDPDYPSTPESLDFSLDLFPTGKSYSGCRKSIRIKYSFVSALSLGSSPSLKNISAS